MNAKPPAPKKARKPRKKAPPVRRGKAPLPGDADGFTAMERLFVLSMPLCDFKPTDAAIRAGYSARSARNAAYRLMSKPRIVEAIEEAKAERAAKLNIDADWHLRALVSVHDDAKADKDRTARKDRLAALDQIGRHVLVNANAPTRVGIGNARNLGPIEHIDLSGLSDEELDAYERLAEKLAPDRPGAADEPDE